MVDMPGVLSPEWSGGVSRLGPLIDRGMELEVFVVVSFLWGGLLCSFTSIWIFRETIQEMKLVA